jgi:hypothetical protein
LFELTVRNRVIGVVAVLALVALWASSRSSSETRSKPGIAKPAPGVRSSGRSRVPHKVGSGSEHAILDESARVVSARASARAAAVLRRPRDAKRDRIVPVEQLFDDLVQLKDGLAEGRGALAAMTPDAAELVELSKQVNMMHDALTRTRLSVLQEWASAARSHLVMNRDEQRQFFAIVNAEAAAIASGERPAPPSARQAPSAAIKALLGPQRFSQYQSLQKSFFRADVHSGEVLP